MDRYLQYSCTMLKLISSATLATRSVALNYTMSLNKIMHISISINNSRSGKFVFDKKENKFIAVENITLINS